MGPAGNTACSAGAGTGPQWLSGLNCGTPSGPAAAAGWAAGTSACWPL